MAATAPVEAKVTWSSLAGAVLTGLVFAANHTDAIPGYTDWPAWVKGILSVLVIAGGTFGAGYAAPHTPRTDPAAAGGGYGVGGPTTHGITPKFTPKDSGWPASNPDSTSPGDPPTR